MAKFAYELYYYAYIGFALGVAVFYLYLTLGGYISPNVSIGSASINLAELVAAIFGAATVFAIYLKYVEESKATPTAQAQKPARRTRARK
ncbi:MAG: hypothetical protein QXP98_06280 [Thermoproteus sp.]